MLLLDTSVLVELEREVGALRVGPARVFLGRHRGEDLACSTITVGELAAGSSEVSVRFLLRKIRKISVSDAIAYTAGALDRKLALTGQRLGENDNWIAATALHLSATLVSFDGDFRRVPGLKARRLAS